MMHAFPHFTPISCFPSTSDWLTLWMWIPVDFGFMTSTNHKTAIKEKHFFHFYFETFQTFTLVFLWTCFRLFISSTKQQNIYFSACLPIKSSRTTKALVHITPVEFKNGGFTLKTYKKRKNAGGIWNRGFVAEKILGQWNPMIIVFEKVSFLKCFLSALKRKASAFQSSGLKSVFVKLRFRYGLQWTEGLTVRTMHLTYYTLLKPQITWIISLFGMLKVMKCNVR